MPYHERSTAGRRTPFHRAGRTRRVPLRFRFAIVATVSLSACITGQRPTLVEDAAIADQAVATVLARLDRAGSVTFRATYDVIPTTTGIATKAVVAQREGRRRVTLGEVEFFSDGTVSRTCRSNTSDCVDFIDDAAISDLNVTNRFWGDAFASRLRVDESRQIGFAEGSTATIAGLPAACVALRVVGGTQKYCALDAGVLARYVGADATIELTSFSFVVDPIDLAL
jgi:hypothetical protein